MKQEMEEGDSESQHATACGSAERAGRTNARSGAGEGKAKRPPCAHFRAAPAARRAASGRGQTSQAVARATRCVSFIWEGAKQVRRWVKDEGRSISSASRVGSQRCAQKSRADRGRSVLREIREGSLRSLESHRGREERSSAHRPPLSSKPPKDHFHPNLLAEPRKDHREKQGGRWQERARAKAGGCAGSRGRGRGGRLGDGGAGPMASRGGIGRRKEAAQRRIRVAGEEGWMVR